jgi:hypothetical protein
VKAVKHDIRREIEIQKARQSDISTAVILGLLFNRIMPKYTLSPSREVILQRADIEILCS